MIASLKDLEKLLKLLRKQGVIDFKHGEISLKLGDLPREQIQAQDVDESASNSPYANFPEGMLSPEQLMYYSAGGDPDDDPENQVTQ